MNGDLIAILTKAGDQLANAATDCQFVKWTENSSWMEAVQLLDELTDSIRELELKLRSNLT